MMQGRVPATHNSWQASKWSLMTPLLACLLYTTGHTDDARRVRPAQRPEQVSQFVGTADCLRCHRRHEIGPEELDYSADVLEFAGLDQSTVWQTSDKHRLAITNLLAERGLRMIERLGLIPEGLERRSFDDGSYRQALQKVMLKTRECLSCHANWLPGEPPPDGRVAQFGVHCEACHGAAAKWYLPHSKPQWRLVPPAEKQTRFGMIDVRDPVVRARECFSCHIGNAAAGKVLTHDMYAAGHPPLPGIEIESYIDQMPRHWRTDVEKGEFAYRAEYLRLNGRRPDDLPRTRGVLLSGIVALQHSARLFAERCETEYARDFAAFNCADCHHDLRVSSWRQESPLRGIRPGRPRPAIWPEVLARVGLAHSCSSAAQLVERQAKFETLLEDLNRAVTSRPFGNALQVRVRSQELLAFLEDILLAAESQPFDEPAALRSLTLLTDPTVVARLDYDAARQIGWGARVLAGEIAAFRQSCPGAGTNELRRAESEPPPRDDGIEELFSRTTKLAITLRLDLPSGTSRSLERGLAGQMGAANSYDPRTFRGELEALHRELRRAFAR